MSEWFLNSDRPLYTRQPEPRDWWTGVAESFYSFLDFSDAMLRRSLAVHEAGHAVLNMAFGIPIAEIGVRDDLGKVPSDGFAAWVRTCGNWSVPYVRYLAMCAAGERAQERWMRELGLWTPERAWVVERCASSDRELVADSLRTARGMELHFGDGNGTAGGMHYATIQTAADSALAHLWDQVLHLAAAVDEHGRLTGRQAAHHADMTGVAIPCDEHEAVAA
ncbi:hypothetical protein BLA24_20410 [Streptomyces cinnamoneus]|uniref:Peptidase M41 domain-containing protein n=1 Tax=Streptomyces cinnamoneus TaxID=53446 RepID=A0A2G1XFG4_STRCJ|nr:hypothetical protein [Streptomyces cinnamoneus]PHQ49980.1 hypothetical protein BLA24_20410 [Streptomyces cinnamoneus]PPT13243.1 hypothetical protein CYQ11_10375 [Streptomyces cinnamoneus]